MRRRFLSLLMVVCMMFITLPDTTIAAKCDTLPTAAEYAANASSVTDYTIDGSTLTIKTAKGAAFWSASGKTYLAWTVKMDADIDVSGFQWMPIGFIDEDANLITFSGTFDGQGHTIFGMNLANNLQLAGMFGSVSGAVIKNLTVSGSIRVTEVTSDWLDENPGFAAGIAGIASDTTITNCRSEVQITANLAVPYVAGGIAAFAGDNARIDGCSNGGEITVKGVNTVFVGGIVGDMELLTASSFIKNCANTGALTVGGTADMVYLGGTVGQKSDNESNEDSNTVVENCYNAGTLCADSSTIVYVGDIAGNNYGDSGERVSNCYNVGTVTGTAIFVSFSAAIVGSNSTGSVYSNYWKTGTADTCLLNGGHIYNCGTFDSIGALVPTTDENAGTGNAVHGLLYGNNLLVALNSWVETQAASADYHTWIVKPGINNGYPIFGVESADTTFDFCNGALAVNEKPSADPVWGTTGYTFAGWYTKPNGEGSQLTGHGEAGVIYYAKWTVGTGANLRTVRTTALDLSRQNSDVDKLSADGWAWYSNASTTPNYAAKTLVLSGLTLNSTEATALKVPAGATIVLTENTTNIIKGGDAASDSGDASAYGIQCVGALTIQGSGNLNATGDTAISSHGIGYSYGIYCMTKLTILGGSVKGTGGAAGSSLLQTPPSTGPV